MSKHLRHYPPSFGVKLLQMFPDFINERHHPARLPPDRRHSCARAAFRDTAWGDMWDDACMKDVVTYLLGNKHLALPADWRELFQDFQ